MVGSCDATALWETDGRWDWEHVCVGSAFARLLCVLLNVNFVNTPVVYSTVVGFSARTPPPHSQQIIPSSTVCTNIIFSLISQTLQCISAISYLFMQNVQIHFFLSWEHLAEWVMVMYQSMHCIVHNDTRQLCSFSSDWMDTKYKFYIDFACSYINMIYSSALCFHIDFIWGIVKYPHCIWKCCWGSRNDLLTVKEIANWLQIMSIRNDIKPPSTYSKCWRLLKKKKKKSGVQGQFALSVAKAMF